MLHTSKERVFHVEIKFKQKIWFIIEKFEKDSISPFSGQKRG